MKTRKIIGTKTITGEEYFRNWLRDYNWTYEELVSTYNSIYQDDSISLSTVQSWASGRRKFSKASAQSVMRIAHILDDPDASEDDFARYAGIAYRLVNGAKLAIYEEQD